MSELIGLLPAGGKGSRLSSFRYPKELLPVIYDWPEDEVEQARPVPVSEISLLRFKEAGIGHCIIVLAPWKHQILAYHGSGSQYGQTISYLCQDEPKSLPHAIDLAYPWVKNSQVALALPDTIIGPSDCFTKLVASHRDSKADLTLGVFPVPDPSKLGPVIFDDDGTVKLVLDKTPNSPVNNAWGIAVWEPSFANLLHSELAEAPTQTKEPVLGSFFNLAIERGLSVRAVFFPDGSFHDLGTPAALHKYMAFRQATVHANENK